MCRAMRDASLAQQVARGQESATVGARHRVRVPVLVRCVMRWRAVAGPSASDGNERPPHVGPQRDGRHGDHTTHRATLTRVTRPRERKPIAKTAPSGHNGSTIRVWQRGTTSPASWVSLRSPVSSHRATGGSARNCWRGSGRCAQLTAKRWSRRDSSCPRATSSGCGSPTRASSSR